MRFGLAICAMAGVLGMAGCNGFESILDAASSILPGNTSHLTPYTAQEEESNDDFTTAQIVSMPENSKLDVDANLSSALDYDIYDVGAVAAGDLITVTCDCRSSLDLAAAVFDAQQRLLSNNDDRNWQTDTRPYLSVIIREDTEHCYVAIAASPSVGTTSGDYTLTVLREASEVPSPRQQVLYLNFAGDQDVILPDMTQSDIPAFNAASIDSSFSGQTVAMRDLIVSHMRNHFARFDVRIVSSGESSNIPKDSSILYFGLYNPNLLGLAESVDEYNSDASQMAIIFVDTFRLFVPLQPTVEEMAIAIANVGSHEAGHLLGLEHTCDAEDLMDTTAPADALLVDQYFKTAPLYDAIFPLGFQDGVMLLTDALGASANAATYNIDRSTFFANTVASADNRPSVKTGVVPSSGEIVSSVGVSWEVRQLLLHGQRSGQGYVSKDSFGVHSRRSARH